MSKNKFFKHIKKYFIFIMIGLIGCVFLSSCKLKKTVEQGPIETPPSVTIATDVSLVTVDMLDYVSIEATLENNNDGVIIWESLDESIATIDQNGVITPISVGITYLKASYSVDKSINTSVKVYVTDNSSRLYPIEFDLNGGSYDGVLPETYSTFDGIANLPNPSKENSAFVGWFNESGEQVTKITNKDRGVIILTAKYNHFPTSLYVKEINEDLWVGKTYQLKVTATNEFGGYKFTSSDENIVTVNESGLITCVGNGDATITVTAIENENTKYKVDVNVYAIPTGFVLSRNVSSIKFGTSTSLKVKASDDTSYPGVIWSSLSPEVATIDKYGVVSTVSFGTASFRATSIVDESIYSDFSIEITPAATSVRILPISSNSLYIGETISLSAQVFPTAISQEVTWQSSDNSIATVSENGQVEIVGRGDVTIFAYSKQTAGILDKLEINALHPLLNEEVSDVKYIICAPGTDAATSISINYHAMSTKTYIEYTVASDVDFENATKYVPEGRYFEELDEALDGPFTARNIFSAEITNLTPNTAYIYRINGGDGTISDTYHFKTASKNPDNFSFVWLTDNHYNTIYEGAQTSEQTIHKAMEMRDDISFVFDTGDMIDTGGNSAIWDKMFTDRQTLKELPLVSTTGNHELYVNGTGQWDNRFHAAYNALPKNGVAEQVGTSCYFIYNDVLFIEIENVSARGYNDQLAWMEELLRSAREDGTAKMIIVGMHAPIQDTNKSDRDETMTALFDKYGVELVLTGHYHTHQVKRNYYEGEVSNNPLLGVNYMIGQSAGAKGAGDGADLGEFAKGYIVDIIGNSIKVTYMNANGKVLGEYQFDSICYEKVSDEAKNISKQEIVDSLTYSVDATLGTISFNWTSLAYGNVQKIKFNEFYRGEANKEVYIMSPEYNKKTLNGVYNLYDSKFEVEFYFTDGTVETKEIVINLSENLNFEYELRDNDIKFSFDELPSNFLYTIKYLEIYADGKLIETTPYNTGIRYLTSYILEDIEVTDGMEFEIRFVNNSGQTFVAREVTITK